MSAHVKAASAMTLKKEICQVFGVDPSWVRGIEITADAGPDLVRVELDMYPSEEQTRELVRLLRERHDGIEISIA